LPNKLILSNLSFFKHPTPSYTNTFPNESSQFIKKGKLVSIA